MDKLKNEWGATGKKFGSLTLKYLWSLMTQLGRYENDVFLSMKMKLFLSMACHAAIHVYQWSSNPENAGSIPTRNTLHFSQLVQVWVL